MNKSDIRKKILKLRKLKKYQNFKINSKYIFQILKKHKLTNKIIGGYYPYNYEIDPLDILKKFEKKKYQISLPKIKINSQMDFFSWSTKEPLEINNYGIPEPTSKIKIFPSILLVPLVAFDKYFNRIGYGGGYYDRYIQKLRNKKKIITIGLAYSFQKVNKIPTKEHDIKLDYVLTNNEN